MATVDAKAELKDNLAKDQVEKSKESMGKDISAPSSTPSAGAVYDVVTGCFFTFFFSNVSTPGF